MTPPIAALADAPSQAVAALDYEFPQLVRRYQDKLGLSAEEARELFEDTKKFLYLCGTNRGTSLAPTEALDDGWHEFLMYTKQYYEFCETYFGGMLHHVPTDPDHPPKGPSNLLRTRQLGEEAFGGLLSTNWELPKALQEAIADGKLVDGEWAGDPCGSCGSCGPCGSCDFT